MSSAESPASHTPGPWINADAQKFHVSYEGIPLGHAEFEISAGGSIVALGMKYGKHAEANARLIAAAPELLEALKRIVCSDCRNGVLYRDSLFFDLEREDDQQQCPNCAPRLAAIAKAESGEPTAKTGTHA